MEDILNLPHVRDPPEPEGRQPGLLWGNERNPDEEPIPNDPINPAEYCAAFREHPLIRNAYVDALIQKVRHGASHLALIDHLKGSRRQLRANPNVPADDLAKMAVTIRTVTRRLGLDSNDIIKTYILCQLCGRSYSPDYIDEAEDSACQNNNCDGVLFDIHKLASGKRKREPRLTYPCASVIAWLERLLSRPGMAALSHSWHTAIDQAAQLAPPLSAEAWWNSIDMDTPLGNITEGHGWRSRAAGENREVDEETGNVEDRSPVDPPARFSNLPFGLSFSLNSDWFQPTKEGNYSVGACYLVLDNLPRHLRFLRENICLVLVTPGPKEPNDYALDQMLMPLIEELLQLNQGVEINIPDEDNPAIFRKQVVHGVLSQHIADLIARIKLGGGSGLKSELNFCLYCRARLSSLSVPSGYIREGFNHRDPQEDLNNAYFWRSLGTAEERRAFFEFTGNRFTAFHQLPGWYTSLCSPPDAMHLFYLGGMNRILIQTLFQPGMLTKRKPTDEDPVSVQLGQTNTKIKADQWKLATRVIFIPLFMAFRAGDVIPNDCQPQNCPKYEDCFSSRNLRFHYKQVLRYSVGVGTLDKRTVTPAEIGFGSQLLETMCIEYINNNIPLPPNFHIMMHLEEPMLKYGSLYNSHVWGMERANGVLSGMNNNGRGSGMLEGTLMRGWWEIANLQNLIKMFHDLPNRTPDDEEVLEGLLSALRGGPEHALQRGTLAAYIARAKTAYTQLYGIHGGCLMLS
ncbi:transposase family Tnp2 protein [Rhizoctonia solani AG-3 Rhs1AP]|uniref:Transposase family Tnp2 protein n=2 Tax=Rhizoctonia solani AG-3 TaxID=1086053 RepID=A0A074RKT4_9AGAM|nr:transposase family Tnp2 protein [Rhizoctonia solani AG-3 Rhs1AP]KEP45965.1 transposase family Tnp2 protein [Rhizoctonia solani 123E]